MSASTIDSIAQGANAEIYEVGAANVLQHGEGERRLREDDGDAEGGGRAPDQASDGYPERREECRPRAAGERVAHDERHVGAGRDRQEAGDEKESGELRPRRQVGHPDNCTEVRAYFSGSFIGRNSRRNGSSTRPKPSSVVAPSSGSSPGSPTMTIESPRLPSYSKVAVASRRVITSPFARTNSRVE